MTALDEALPDPHFSERHTRWIRASAQQVWETLSLDQLRITRGLVAVRHLGAEPVSISRSLLTDGPVRLLEVDPPWYAVGGAIARPWQLKAQRRNVESLEGFAAFTEPGWVKYLTDFSVRPSGDGAQLTTVTRGCGTDWTARARFVPYWALIRLPSGLIRREMLAAVDRAAQAARAEADLPPSVS